MATKSKSNGVHNSIRKKFKAKVDELRCLKELDTLLERRNMGLEIAKTKTGASKPVGDMKGFVSELVKKLALKKKKEPF